MCALLQILTAFQVLASEKTAEVGVVTARDACQAFINARMIVSNEVGSRMHDKSLSLFDFVSILIVFVLICFCSHLMFLQLEAVVRLADVHEDLEGGMCVGS